MPPTNTKVKKEVLDLRVTLLDVDPSVWRLIAVDQATAPVSTVASDRVTESHGGPGPLAAHLQPLKTKKPCNSKVFLVAPTGFELLTSGPGQSLMITQSLTQ
jgi:hypothetical protein